MAPHACRPLTVKLSEIQISTRNPIFQSPDYEPAKWTVYAHVSDCMSAIDMLCKHNKSIPITHSNTHSNTPSKSESFRLHKNKITTYPMVCHSGRQGSDRKIHLKPCSVWQSTSWDMWQCMIQLCYRLRYYNKIKMKLARECYKYVKRKRNDAIQDVLESNIHQEDHPRTHCDSTLLSPSHSELTEIQIAILPEIHYFTGRTTNRPNEQYMRMFLTVWEQ